LAGCAGATSCGDRGGFKSDHLTRTCSGQADRTSITTKTACAFATRTGEVAINGDRAGAGANQLNISTSTTNCSLSAAANHITVEVHHSIVGSDADQAAICSCSSRERRNGLAAIASEIDTTCTTNDEDVISGALSTDRAIEINRKGIDVNGSNSCGQVAIEVEGANTCNSLVKDLRGEVLGDVDIAGGINGDGGQRSRGTNNTIEIDITGDAGSNR